MAIDPIMLGLMKKASSGTSGTSLNGYVSCSPQTFSEAQKTQARENIGAASESSADPTNIVGYSGTSKQWLRQNNGTLEWVTDTSIPDGVDAPMEDGEIDTIFGSKNTEDNGTLEDGEINGVFGQ